MIHNKGPWLYKFIRYFEVAELYNQDKLIATIEMTNYQNSKQNLNLIAASPDMFSALSVVSCNCNDSHEFCCYMPVVEKALLKAKGYK